MSKRKVSIIAMKGPPYTFKTTAASAIGKSLGYPVICVDDILDGLSQHHHYASTSTPSPEEAERLSNLALDIICQMAKSFFEQGIFDTIVIDSRLSSPSQVDRLINWAGSFRDISCVLIIEFTPKNNYSLQMKFEESVVTPCQWYKPKCWDDVEKAILQDFVCDVQSLRSDLFRVSKLVLDSLTALQYLDLTEIGKTPPLVEAVKCLMGFKDEDPCVLNFDEWRAQLQSSGSHDPPEKQNLTMTRPFCRNGHSISNYMEEGLGYDANCIACKEPIIGAAYTCDSCSLALHKACAEFDGPLNISFRNDGLLIDSFGEYQSCSYCAQEGRQNIARFCQSCLFESNLKLRLMPTVINHEAHKHFLSVRFMPVTSFEMFLNVEFYCMACGLNSRDRACYFCKLCGFSYELNCANLPHRVLDKHGGHSHRMTLKCSAEEAEDYMCYRCLDKRDPRCWFYSCDECTYETHLRCSPTKVHNASYVPFEKGPRKHGI